MVGTKREDSWPHHVPWEQDETFPACPFRPTLVDDSIDLLFQDTLVMKGLEIVTSTHKVALDKDLRNCGLVEVNGGIQLLSSV
jgi:hypothetical protein